MAASKPVYLLANGDLRLSANQNCWAEQEKVEEAITRARAAAEDGTSLCRA